VSCSAASNLLWDSSSTLPARSVRGSILRFVVQLCPFRSPSLQSSNESSLTMYEICKQNTYTSHYTVILPIKCNYTINGLFILKILLIELSIVRNSWIIMVSRAESAYFLKTLKYTSGNFTLKTQQIRAMSMARGNGRSSYWYKHRNIEGRKNAITKTMMHKTSLDAWKFKSSNLEFLYSLYLKFGERTSIRNDFIVESKINANFNFNLTIFKNKQKIIIKYIRYVKINYIIYYIIYNHSKNAFQHNNTHKVFYSNEDIVYRKYALY